MTGMVQHARWSPSTAPFQEWWELLRAELTLAPERTARMVRMTVLVMLVVLISMALRVPEAAISAYMIFFAARDDGPSSVKSAVGLIVAITGALLVGLVLLSLTEGEPSLRLAGVVVLTLVAMYAQRRSPKLGLLGYAVGFVSAMFLVYAGHFPTPELTLRSMWWLWVVIAYPAALLAVCEGIFGDDPEALLRNGLASRLTAVASSILSTPEEGDAAQKRVERLERIGTGGLAGLAGHGPAALVPLRTSLMGEVQSLLLLAGHIPALPASSPLRGPLRQAAATCLDLARELREPKGSGLEPPAPPVPDEVGHRAGDPDPLAGAAVLALLASVRTVALAMAQLREASHLPPPPPVPAPAPSPMELESQRAEALHFACKVTLAAMTAYILFTALDWWGTHTALITCFFVAQESVGATIHKSALRLTGALVGGALGIASLVFILPRMDSGGELALLVGAVTLLATWFATGSQRISYAGWQIAFAFFLTVLQGFERTTNMVVARDRVLGILLGNALMSIVFLHLWPVRLAPRISQGVSRALDALAGLISVEGGGPDAAAHSAQLQRSFVEGLSRAGEVAFFARFEPGGAGAAGMVPALSGLLIPARALSLSTPSEAR
ncbi:MAG TPA: FUSC family protein, partial [Myxococcaceae bacterium]|nr:FUSC family protein [Myxococcaceae bacterium]